LDIAESPKLAAEDLASFLSTAVAAARAAGVIINEGAKNRAGLTIERKNANDFVSVIDKSAERAIIETLAAKYPGHAFKAEESGEAGTSRYTWVIDPLDGTTNFLQGIPYYCVSIALQIDDSIAVAVIYDPTSGRLFTATRGHGAFLDGVRIHVSGRPGLTEAVVGTGLPFRDWSYLDDYLASLRVIMQRCAGIRRPGAAALDLACVSAGWIDGHWEKGLNAWDMAAGGLLIQEAGGVVTTFNGSEAFLNSGQVLAGTPGVHAELLDVLRRYPTLAP
jgi:myo-inositol-1(or 4)-monophosphatase